MRLLPGLPGLIVAVLSSVLTIGLAVLRDWLRRKGWLSSSDPESAGDETPR